MLAFPIHCLLQLGINKLWRNRKECRFFHNPKGMRNNNVHSFRCFLTVKTHSFSLTCTCTIILINLNKIFFLLCEALLNSLLNLLKPPPPLCKGIMRLYLEKLLSSTQTECVSSKKSCTGQSAAFSLFFHHPGICCFPLRFGNIQTCT